MTPKKDGRVGYLDFAARPPARVPSLVVIAGREHALADEVVTTITAQTLPDEGLRALNFDLIDARAGGDLDAIAEKTAAMPFLADRRMVVVRGTIDLKKEERERVIAACAAVADHALLIVDHSGTPSRPQGRRPREEAQTYAAARREALLVDCTLDAAACEKYIERYAAAIGIAIDAQARHALAATEDVSEIKNTLDRLALTLKRISLKDVQEYALPSEEVKLWTLGDAVNAGDAQRALRLMREVVDRPDDAIGPLIWLAGDAQAIWELANGSTPESYAQALGQSPWRYRNLAHAARRLPRRRLAERVHITMQALERAISGGREKDQALEEVIVRLCATK